MASIIERGCGRCGKRWDGVFGDVCPRCDAPQCQCEACVAWVVVRDLAGQERAMSDPVKCRGCDDIRSTSCGTVDCPVPLQVSGDLDFSDDEPPVVSRDLGEVPAARAAREERRHLQDETMRKNIWNSPTSGIAIKDLAGEILAHGTQAMRLPVLQTFSLNGTWRIYFHRLNPDGMPWNVAPDAGGWELAVREVEIAVPAHAVYKPKATPDDEDGRPSAWIEASGVLTMTQDGKARIE